MSCPVAQWARFYPDTSNNNMSCGMDYTDTVYMTSSVCPVTHHVQLNLKKKKNAITE